MSIFYLIIITVALSTEAFSGIYFNGFLKEKETLLLSKAKVVLLVTLTNVVMGVLGFAIGGLITSLVSEFSAVLSQALLFLLGLKLIIKSFKPKFQEMTWELTNHKILLGFSLALSMNTFILGLSLPGLNANLLTFTLTVATVFSISSLIALITGAVSKRFLLASRLMLIGGVIISGSAMYFIIESFNFI